MYSFALKINVLKHMIFIKFSSVLNDVFRNFKLNTLTNNYSKRFWLMYPLSVKIAHCTKLCSNPPV